MALPFTVGVTPGVSEDESDEEDVSGEEDELIELILFFMAPGATSFRGIDVDVPPESILGAGKEELLESVDSLDSTSSLNLDSCEERRVSALSAANNGLGESVLGMLIRASFRGGTAEGPPLDVDLEILLSLLVISDWELLLEVPDLFPFGTSPNLNFSLEDWFLPLTFEDFGELACCTRVSSPPIAGEAFAD